MDSYLKDKFQVTKDYFLKIKIKPQKYLDKTFFNNNFSKLQRNMLKKTLKIDAIKEKINKFYIHKMYKSTLNSQMTKANMANICNSCHRQKLIFYYLKNSYKSIRRIPTHFRENIGNTLAT